MSQTYKLRRMTLVILVKKKIEIKASLHMLTFEKDEDIEKSFDIKNIHYTKLRIEELCNRLELVKQCKKCQRYGQWAY